MSDNLTILPGLLTNERIKMGLTQAQLADEINSYIGEVTVHTPRISNWEKGIRKVPTKYNDAIAHIFGVDISKLTNEGLQLQKINNTNFPSFKLSFHELHNYDGLPVYVEIIDSSSSSGWGIIDGVNGCIMMLDKKIPFRQLSTKTHELYRYLQQSPAYTKPISSPTELKKYDQIYIKLISFDRTLSAQYNGWYHHNENYSALINNDGLTLPYSGLNYSYRAYIE